MINRIEIGNIGEKIQRKSKVFNIIITPKSPYVQEITLEADKLNEINLYYKSLTGS